MRTELTKTEAKPKRKAADSQGIQVLARAADILRALKANNRGLSLGQIARDVSLPRSTVQRIVNALVTEKLVEPNRQSGGYQLGPEVMALALASRHDVTRALHPVLEKLAGETGETVDLAVFRDDGMVFVDQISGTQRLRTVSAIGETFPMSVTANGKAALGILDLPTAMRIAEIERLQSKTDKTKDIIKSDIEHYRETGYALDIDEHTEGISAAGISFEVGGAIYAISIPVPSQRFHREQKNLLQHLLAAKAEISKTLPDAQF